MAGCPESSGSIRSSRETNSDKTKLLSCLGLNSKEVQTRRTRRVEIVRLFQWVRSNSELRVSPSMEMKFEMQKGVEVESQKVQVSQGRARRPPGDLRLQGFDSAPLKIHSTPETSHAPSTFPHSKRQKKRSCVIHAASVSLRGTGSRRGWHQSKTPPLPPLPPTLTGRISARKKLTKKKKQQKTNPTTTK